MTDVGTDTTCEHMITASRASVGLVDPLPDYFFFCLQISNLKPSLPKAHIADFAP